MKSARVFAPATLSADFDTHPLPHTIILGHHRRTHNNLPRQQPNICMTYLERKERRCEPAHCQGDGARDDGVLHRSHSVLHEAVLGDNVDDFALRGEGLRLQGEPVQSAQLHALHVNRSRRGRLHGHRGGNGDRHAQRSWPQGPPCARARGRRGPRARRREAGEGRVGGEGGRRGSARAEGHGRSRCGGGRLHPLGVLMLLIGLRCALCPEEGSRRLVVVGSFVSPRCCCVVCRVWG